MATLPKPLPVRRPTDASRKRTEVALAEPRPEVPAAAESRTSDVPPGVAAVPSASNGTLTGGLAAARRALADTEARTAEHRRLRHHALVEGRDDQALDAIDADIAALERLAQRHRDRIALLEEEERRAEAERQEQARQAEIARIEAVLGEADQAAAELQALLAEAEVKYRRIIELREQCRPAFAGGDAHAVAAAGAFEGAALSGFAVRALVAHELHRIGARPYLGGVPGVVRQADFPGGAPASLGVVLQPEKIAPLADRFREASKFAVNLLRGVGAIRPAVSAPPRQDGSTKVREKSTETTAQPVPGGTRMAELLQQQAMLASDLTPEGDRRYAEVVAEIAVLSGAGA
jgi:hypothetical protein